MSQGSFQLDYRPDGIVLYRFLASRARVKAIRGPWGSGKSVACCIDLFMRARSQVPSPRDGVRRTRFAVIRNTAPELKTTTIKTWLDWFPEHRFGKFRWSPPYTHPIRIPVGDGTTIESEVIFLALDDETDVKKLLSLEITAAWINEAREVPKAIIDAIDGRVDRYPSKRDGGATYPGIILDTNPPDETHWWPIMAGDVPPPEDLPQEDLLTLVKPRTWEFFTQPPAMLEVKDENGNLVGYEMNRGQREGIPPAENTRHQSPSYWENMIQGKSRSWIRVNVLNEIGTVGDEKRVWTAFDPHVHVAARPLDPIPESTVYVGVDFGLTPAAVFAQRVGTRWFVLGELMATDMGARRFGIVLRAELARRFADCPVMIFGDPAGDHRAQSDEKTPMQILRALGIPIRPAPTNDLTVRIEAVAAVLDRAEDGKPCFVLSPSCRMLKAAMAGGYCYRRLKVKGTVPRYDQQPDKNRYSHIADALQYLMLGGGEGAQLIRQRNRADVGLVPRPYSVWDRLTRGQRIGGVHRLSKRLHA